MNNSLSYGFHKIKLAYVFIFVNINLTLMGRTMDMLPDFIGYLIMLSGVRILAGYNKNLKLLEPLVSAMSAIQTLKILDVMFFGGLYPKVYFITVAVYCVYIYLHFRLLTGIIEIMEDNGLPTKHMALSRNILLVTRTFAVITDHYSSIVFTTSAIGMIIAFRTVMLIIVNLWRYFKLATSIWTAENKLKNIETVSA